MPHLYDEDPRSTILIIPNPFLNAKPRRSTGVYFSGIFVSVSIFNAFFNTKHILKFSLGWWVFLDAYVISKKSSEPLTLVDWMPGVASSLGLLMSVFSQYLQKDEQI